MKRGDFIDYAAQYNYNEYYKANAAAYNNAVIT